MKTVRSQKEFEDAYANGECEFDIVGFVVVLRGSSRAVLRESSRAELWDFAVAHKLSNQVKIKKGSMAVVIIPEYPSNMKDWCALKGIKVKNNRIKLWKCTNKNGCDFYTGKINYSTKAEITCPDWEEHYKKECGYGLHLADSPQGALFFCKDRDSARLFEVSCNINDCECFGGNPDYPTKIRVKKCRMVKEYPIKDFII